MAKMQYIYGRNPQKKTLEMIHLLDSIVTEYVNAGFTLTVRQAFYQMVARGYIKNTPAEYDRVQRLLSDGRLYGMIDWNGIEDRGRSEKSNTHWNSPQEILYSVARSYATDKRATQPNYIEMWIEKDALIGILEPLARKYDVTCFACKGYPSVSTMKEAAERFIDNADKEHRVLLYAGDHDPSGMDISRSIQDSLHLFGAIVQFKRIGLSMEQIKKYNPPPCTAKETDKRWKQYEALYGPLSWELDALEPNVLSSLYAQEIEALTDWELYKEAERNEQTEIGQLNTVYQNWNRIFQA